MKILDKIQSRKFIALIICVGICIYNPAALTWPLVVIVAIFIGGQAIQNITEIIRGTSQLPPTQGGPDNGAVQ